MPDKNEAKPAVASETEVKGPSAVVHVLKTSLCILGFVASVAFFAYACLELKVDYFRLFAPTAPQTLSWLVRLGLGAFLSLLTFGVMAVFVRPMAVAGSAVLVGLAVFGAILGGGLAVWCAVGAVAVLLLTMLFSVAKQFENQIDFSVRPMGDRELALSSLLAVLVAVSAGMGYVSDAARAGYLVPPQVTAALRQQTSGYVKTMVDSQDLPAAVKAVALSTAEEQVAGMIDGYQEKLKPYAAYVPYGIGALAYFSFQIVFFVPGFAASLALGPLLFVLRLVGFAHLSKQTRVVTRLMLAEEKGNAE